jgi:large subunit ribosomal protein L35
MWIICYNNESIYLSAKQADGYPIMPKMKTHKGTKKRFRLTAKGKVKHRSAGTSHLASRKTHKNKRNLRGTTVLDGVDSARIRTVLGKHSY